MENVVSIFLDMVTPVEAMTINDIHELISTGVLKKETDQLRLLLKESNREAFNSQKKKLVAVTFSGQFQKGRKLENLVEYTQLICLDFDKVPSQDELNRIKDIIKEVPYTKLVFTSPSGNGLKVVVEVNSNAEEHKLVYAQVADHYEKLIGYKADHTSDVARLCFLCHDKDAFLNEGNEVYAFKSDKGGNKEYKKHEKIAQVVDCQAREVFDYAVKYTENLIRFEEGSRNNFVFTLANNCNKLGLCEEFVKDLCIERYAETGFNETEIERTVNQSYSLIDHHNTWKRPVGLNYGITKATESLSILTELTGDTSPFFGDDVYNNLPGLVRDTTDLFTAKREKDMFLMAFITILSGSLHNVKGWYYDDELYPNLFTLLISPSASGKRVMSKAMDIVSWVIANRKSNYAPLISINGTFKSIFNKLHDSEGCGVLYDEEIEALSKIIKHDKNGMGFLLKQGHDNRMLPNGRLASGQQTIKIPKFSFLTAGNAHQLTEIVPNTSDGAYSRHLYYTYNEPTPFYSVKPSMWKDFVEQKEEYTDLLTKFVDFTLMYPFDFTLTDDQFEIIKENGLLLQKEYNVIQNLHMDQIIKRGGRGIFKIAMVLSSFRKWREGNKEKEYVCHDTDFDTAFSMMQTLIVHSYFAGEILKSEGKVIVSNVSTRREKMLQALPDCFTKEDAESGLKSMGYNVNGRTVYNDLKNLIQEGLLTHQHNKYCKHVSQ